MSGWSRLRMDRLTPGTRLALHMRLGPFYRFRYVGRIREDAERDL
jgi:hypothetical protein